MYLRVWMLRSKTPKPHNIYFNYNLIMLAFEITGLAYGLVTNAESINSLVHKFTSTYKSELTDADKRLLRSLERRVTCLIEPLNFLMLTFQSNQNSICSTTIN